MENDFKDTGKVLETTFGQSATGGGGRQMGRMRRHRGEVVERVDGFICRVPRTDG